MYSVCACLSTVCVLCVRARVSTVCVYVVCAVFVHCVCVCARCMCECTVCVCDLGTSIDFMTQRLESSFECPGQLHMSKSEVMCLMTFLEVQTTGEE